MSIILTDAKPTTNAITTAITHIAQWTLLLMMLVAIGAGLTIAVTEPDHVSGKVSNDFPVMGAK